ncbi:hypothetical protein ACKS0A_02529 [Histoplasma ohiense]
MVWYGIGAVSVCLCLCLCLGLGLGVWVSGSQSLDKAGQGSQPGEEPTSCTEYGRLYVEYCKKGKKTKENEKKIK